MTEVDGFLINSDDPTMTLAEYNQWGTLMSESEIAEK